MALSTYDISVDQGSDFSTTITYADDAGDPTDLTGCTAKMQVRRFAGSPAAFLTLSNGNGITLGGALGTIGLAVSGTALSQVPAGLYAYDLELTDTTQKVLKILAGKFVINAEVTR